jgi:hypothetical protein
MKRICLFLLLLGCAGCYEAGTWDDPAQNFQRAFHDAPPDKLVIVHSWYTRSRYFASEFAYFMEIQPNSEFKIGLWQNNKLQQASTAKDLAPVLKFPVAKPAWFVPKPLDQYEVWIYADKPFRHFRIFIDKQTQELFLADYE